MIPYTYMEHTEIIDELDELEITTDCQGTALSSGDTVQVIKDLNVRGTKLSIKSGTVIKNIKLTGDTDEIECRINDMKGIILRTEFLRKKN